MKKVCIFFMGIVLVISMTSCYRHRETYDLLNPEEEISYIAIAEALYDEEEGTKDNEIVEIEDDYELINCDGQSKYTLERGYNMYAGHYIFEEEDYEKLLNKYLAYGDGGKARVVFPTV